MLVPLLLSSWHAARFAWAHLERNVRPVALEGMAKWSAGLLAICGYTLTLTLSGCASTPSRTAVGPTHDHWLSSYVLGIWGTADLDVRDDCPETGASEVQIGATWATLAVTVATLGIYTPREARVQCR